MGINATCRCHPHHFRHKGRIVDDDIRWYAARTQNFLAVIKVVDESIHRPHTLLYSRRKASPFRGCKHTGNDVKRNQPFRSFVISINRKGNALAAEARFGFACGAFDIFLFEGLQPVFNLHVRRAYAVGLVQHLVENCRHAHPVNPQLVSNRHAFQEMKQHRRGPFVATGR